MVGVNRPVWVDGVILVRVVDGVITITSIVVLLVKRIASLVVVVEEGAVVMV